MSMGVAPGHAFYSDYAVAGILGCRVGAKKCPGPFPDQARSPPQKVGGIRTLGG